MSMFRRIITLAGATLAGAVLLVAPSSVASAQPLPLWQKVDITVTFVVVDDDFWSDTTQISGDAQTGFVSAADPRTFFVFKSACAGDEVRGELALQVDRLADGRVRVQDSVVNNVLGLRLYEGQEGTGCPFTDLDGHENVPDFSVSPGNPEGAGPLTVFNQEFNAADSVTVTFTVTNTTV